MVDYKKYWFEIICILGVALVMIGVVIVELDSTIFYDYKNNYDMYSKNEQVCFYLGISEVVVNNETYTCSQIMSACNINVSYTDDTLDINYDIVPFCNGIFWGG